MGTNIRIQNARLLGRRLNIRDRRLEDEAFIQPSVQSYKRKSKEDISFASTTKVRICCQPGRNPFLAMADAGSENCHCQCSFSNAVEQ